MKKLCLKCEKERHKINDFYQHPSPLYSDNRFPVCKDCLEYISNMKNKQSMMDLMRMIDRPFLFEEWRASLKYKNPFREYMRRLAMPHNRELTWSDSILDIDKSENNEEYLDVESDELEKRYDEEDFDIIITPKMRIFWRGYNDEEIKILENYYQELIASYECETPVQRSIYRNMAITQYLADNAKSASEFDKLMGTLSKLMNDANVKPVQESGVNDSGLSTWGEWIKKIEETEPIPEPREEFKDVDNIRKYINKWFVSHFAKIFGINNDDNVHSFTNSDGDK